MATLGNGKKTAEIIEKYRFSFQKKFGQNFLIDSNILEKIVDSAELTEQDCVLEIGPGIGTMTQYLAEQAREVIAVEIDKNLIPILEETLGDYDNVTVINEDILKVDINRIVQERNGGRPIKVVANLPYYITTPIIFRLFEEATKLESITIMVQKEVAERVCAKAGGKDYGILTVMTNYYGTPKIARIIKRQMFFPEPNVDSALLVIKLDKNKFSEIDSKAFSRFVKACFSMRRKTMLNNLSTIYPKDKLKEVLDEKTLSARAEQFDLDGFIEIFKKLENV